MNGHKIDFDAMPWASSAENVRAKIFADDGRQVRLVTFSEGFVEPDWCRKGHVGYIVGGSCNIDYSGRPEHYRPGDVFFIRDGEADRHKLSVGEEGSVTILLFETLPG